MKEFLLQYYLTKLVICIFSPGYSDKAKKGRPLVSIHEDRTPPACTMDRKETKRCQAGGLTLNRTSVYTIMHGAGRWRDYCLISCPPYTSAGMEHKNQKDADTPHPFHAPGFRFLHDTLIHSSFSHPSYYRHVISSGLRRGIP